MPGDIPAWLEDMEFLHDLHLYGNHFSGYVPMSAVDMYAKKASDRVARQERIAYQRQLHTT